MSPKWTIQMMMRRKLTSNYWKWKGFVPEVTWGLNLMLGDAPAKGSVLNYEITSIRPLYFFS